MAALSEETGPFPKCMINPDSRFSFLWQIALVFLLLYTATIMPYRMAFVEPVVYDTWWYIELVVDVGFVTDVCVNLLSAYYDAESKLVTDRRRIFFNYLRSWMILDVVA
jgi:hypothetical protein